MKEATKFRLIAISLVLSLFIAPSASQFRRAICCPFTPMELCDFYFSGYQYSIPVYHLDDGLHGDHAISPVPVAKIGWRGSIERFSPPVVDAISQQIVLVYSTNKNGSYLTCPIPTPEWINPGDQFYLSGSSDNIGRLWARTWQKRTSTQWGIEYYKNRCIKIPLTGVQIPAQYGPINLNPGDGNKNYTEERRCIVFKTHA